MIDIHCHILPGFDDGSSSLSESLVMVRMALSSGVTAIVATPHFPGEAESLPKLKTLLSRYERLKKAIEKENLPLTLYPGAEILCLSETPQLAARHQLPTIGNSNYLLVEFYFDESADYMTGMLDQLLALGYGVVVAHPERYGAVQHDPTLVQHWFRRGCVIQLNKGSLLGAFGAHVRMTADWLLEQGLVHLIASDAHSARRRTTHMSVLTDLIESRCDPEYAEILLERNPRRVLEGRPMVPIQE